MTNASLTLQGMALCIRYISYARCRNMIDQIDRSSLPKCEVKLYTAVTPWPALLTATAVGSRLSTHKHVGVSVETAIGHIWDPVSPPTPFQMEEGPAVSLGVSTAAGSR